MTIHNSSKKFETPLEQAVATRQRRKTSANFEFDIASDTWEIAPGIYIRWALYGHLATPAFIKRLKEDIFAELLSNNRLHARTVYGYEVALRNCLEFTHDEGADLVDDLTDDIIAAWRSKAAGKSYPWYVKTLITKAREIDKQYFPHVTTRLLDKIRTPKNINYEVVETLDADHGPYDTSENHLMQMAMNHAYLSGKLHVEQYCLVQLYRDTGMRSESISRLKVRDLRLPMLGYETPQIRFPFAKNTISIDRAPFWPVTRADLANALEDYLKLRLQGIPRDEWGALPVFTPEGLPGAWRTAGKGGNQGSKKIRQEDGYFGHATAKTLINRFVSTLKGLHSEETPLISHRTGEVINFTAHRERHTKAMQLAFLGCTADHIAYFLGHGNAKSANAYVDTAILISQILNHDFLDAAAPIISAFQKAATIEEMKQSDFLPVSRYTDVNDNPNDPEYVKQLLGGGNCHGCQFSEFTDYDATEERWACLNCPRFHVWVDADLNPIYNQILREIARLKDPETGEVTGEYNHDSYIFLLDLKTRVEMTEGVRQRELQKREALSAGDVT